MNSVHNQNTQFQSSAHTIPARTVTIPQRYSGEATNVGSRVNYALQRQNGDAFVSGQFAEMSEKKTKRKRAVKSVLLTLGTIVGLAALGNCSSNKMAELGQKLDDVLLKQDWYKSLQKSTKTAKEKVKTYFLKNDNETIRQTARDIQETFSKRRSQPEVAMAKGYGSGFKNIFCLTPPDVIKTSMHKIEAQNPGQAMKSLEKLVGKDKAKTLYEKIMGEGVQLDNRKFCDELTDAIAENFGAKVDGKVDNKKLLSILKDLQKGNVNGVDLTEFTNVKMNDSKGVFGLMSNWSSVNLIDSFGEKCAKAMGKDWKGFGRGNLGDALVKSNVVCGKLADTGAGSFVQKMITVPTESISNFVNDKSNMGILLSAMIFMLYQNMQKAPEGQKAATVADDYVGTLGSLAIATPLAFGATYGLATLSHLEGKNGLSKTLKNIGKVFDFGHDKMDKAGNIIKSKKGFLNSMKKFGGHTLRFALIMFVFSSMFMKPIRGAIQKVFGKPYVEGEENVQKNSQLQAQAKAMGISEEEMEALAIYLQNNPEAMNIFAQQA